MNVTFVGSGNVAWHLAAALDNTDYHVREVYSRNVRHAAALAERLYQATPSATLDFSGSASRIFIIAVPDDAIADVAQQILLPGDAMLIHTSGSQPMDILANAPAAHIGVFYPLQSFSKRRKVDFAAVPVFVEGNSAETDRILVSMGGAISKKVTRASSRDRRALHLAAVFASNFTNHMLAIARDLLPGGVNFEYLKPLIAETINKALDIGPAESQTGPARRGDLQVLDMHMDLLRSDESVSEIYRVISQHIVDRYAG